MLLTENLTPTIAKDLLTPTPVQHAESGNGIIYAVLHIPAFKYSHSAGDSACQEIDFIISGKGVITARYDSIDALHYLSKQLEVNEILDNGEDCHIFFRMMEEIYKGMADQLSYIEDWMKEIEKNIFDGHEREMVLAISNAGRNLLNFKRTIDAHGDIFEFLKNAGGEKFGKKFETEAKALIDDWRRMVKRVNNLIDMATELRETNNSLLSTKQNEIMKNLAVIGSILLPLSVISQIFGMSIRNFPLIDNPQAFWIILGMMVSVMVISLSFAKFKKWM
jgi:magnesium transporter